MNLYVKCIRNGWNNRLLIMNLTIELNSGIFFLICTTQTFRLEIPGFEEVVIENLRK